MFSTALEEKKPKGQKERDRQKATLKASALEAATAPSCLITPLSLPSLLFLIVRAALQYFYQMISPSSSAALMFMKMILHRNASCMPRCHCLSSSLASTCVYKCVFVFVEGGWGCHNRLSSCVCNYVRAYLRSCIFTLGETCVSACESSIFCSLCVCVKSLLLFLCELWLRCWVCECAPPTPLNPSTPFPLPKGIIHRT